MGIRLNGRSARRAKRFLVSACLCLASLGVAGSWAIADHHEDKVAGEMPLPEGWTPEDMQNMIAATTPGKEQEFLAQIKHRKPGEHRQRLFTALEDLQIATWPYPGAIGLVERFTPGRSDAASPPHPHDFQIHVVRHWCYLGSATDHQNAGALDSVAAGFDADGYKILCKPVLRGRAEVSLLS